MAAFAPLNHIVWRDYTSITVGLEINVPENNIAATLKIIARECGGDNHNMANMSLKKRANEQHRF